MAVYPSLNNAKLKSERPTATMRCPTCRRPCDHLKAKPPSLVAYDAERDIVKAFGLKIQGDVFRLLCEPTPVGIWFRVIKVEDGIVTIEQERKP